MTITLLAFGSCHPGGNPAGPNMLRGDEALNKFAAYWNKGEGEINSYELEQAHYGEMRKGEAVLLFATEDFSKSKHVKLDEPGSAGDDKVPVLKLNHIRRFVTGVYDYSMMCSVFTPVNTDKFPNSLKATATSQDWCGHSFMQANLDGNKINLQSFSYFEKEGDEKKSISAALLEDELWNRIRINPAAIPTGEVEIVPAFFHARLKQAKTNPKKARIRIEPQAEMNLLILEYLHLDRTLTVGYEPVFPYKILSWTEYDDGQLTSRGILKENVKSAYWLNNSEQPKHLRDSLLFR